MGVEIQDSRGVFYQHGTGKLASISAGGSINADRATIKN